MNMEFSASFSFIHKEFVTMDGHTILKNIVISRSSVYSKASFHSGNSVEFYIDVWDV
jgi:hypothetical protein